MDFYINNMPEDFNIVPFNPDYNRSFGNDWDFAFREGVKSTTIGNSELTLNLRKRHPK